MACQTARNWVAALVGLFLALWYPLLSFVGFFSSEQPFAGAIALSALLLVRQVESGKGAVLLGVVFALVIFGGAPEAMLAKSRRVSSLSDGMIRSPRDLLK